MSLPHTTNVPHFFSARRCFSLLVFALIFCLGISFTGDAEAKTKHKKSQTQASKGYTPPYAHIVIDATSGRVLTQEDADRALYPASLTKLMTLLMAFEALDSKTITLQSSVPMSTHATGMPPSKIGLRAGQSLSVENAIKALVTKSANDVAVALGEKLGGSESRFAQMMNLKARAIGMSQTHFENASGLHKVQQVSSARDMAKLALYIQRTYPHYYGFFALREFYFNGKVNQNHNHLMKSYQGMDGMKTGYISQSGFNLVASAKRGNTRLIGVIFGGKSANSRNAQMAKLLDRGFEQATQRPDQLRSASVISLPSVAPKTIAQETNKETNKVQRTDIVKAESKDLPPPSSTAKTAGMKTLQISSPDTTPAASPQTLVADSSKQILPPSVPVPAPSPQSLGTLSVAAPVNRGAITDNATPSPAPGWSVQIGAYQDRTGTDRALYQAVQKLPVPLNKGTPLVVPLKTSSSTWMFRARIGGYTKEQALQACRYLDQCLPISPGTN